MPQLALYLLGPPRVERDGKEVHIGRRKALALLAYLAVTGERHQRDALATLLWPEYDQSGARTDLRRTLSLLNRALGEGWLDVDRETAGLRQAQPESSGQVLWLDVAAFQARLAECEGHGHAATEVCTECVPPLAEAVRLYRDDFLAGFTLRDSLAFDEWQFFQTQGLRDELAGALVRLANYYTSQGDFEPAIAYARRWLALDPTHEPAQRHLMVLYAQAGQRAAALRQYELCRELLAKELGVEPSQKTQETYTRLVNGELPAGPTAVEAILERELRTVGACPYRGLSAFREVDAPFFFGRESFTERVSAAVQERPLVAVIVGSSGSGKSSAVYAGLLPRLRDAGDWLIADFRPGHQPFHALAAALLPSLEPGLAETDRLIETRKLAVALREGDLALFDVVGRVLEKSPATRRALLLIDQFEELYTLCPQPDVRRRFLDTLLAAVEPSGERHASPLVLLLTLRADFMGQALAHRPFADALQEASLLMGPMTREELRAAILKPAEKQGAALEAGLVERLLDDVGEEPGNLPLLEFALTLLWERLDYGWMTHAAYEGIGRVEGALALYAEQVYGALEVGEREGARRVFVQLVQPGEGTEDTRRTATRAELGDDTWELVQHLADKRLVVTGRDAARGDETVEVVHEALIQRWGQLQAWMAHDRAFRTWQERLRGALRAWEGSDQDQGALLRGAPLAEAESWVVEREDELSPAEVDFVQAGVALRERRRVEREQRRRRVVLSLAGGLVLAVALALVAVFFARQSDQDRQAADEQAEIAFSREVAAAALANLEVDPERSILLALQTLSTRHTFEAESALHRAILASPVRQTFVNQETGSFFIAASPDGQRLFVSGRGGGTMWDIANGGIVFTHTVPGRLATQADFSPDGSLLALPAVDYYSDAPAPGRVTIINAETGNELINFVAQHPAIWQAAFSPDGRLLTIIDDTRVKMWDVETTLAAGTSQLVHTLCCLDDGESYMAFSPDGRHLAANTLGKEFAKVWDVASGAELFTVGPKIGRVVFSPDGNYLVSSDAGLIQIWDATTGERLSSVTSPDYSGANRVSFSPDGSLLATSNLSGQVIVWRFSLEGMQQLQTFRGHRDSANAVFSPDGNYLFTSSNDGTTRIWDLFPAASGELGAINNRAGIPGFINDVVVSADGSTLVTVGGDGMLRIWNTATWEEEMGLPAHEDGIRALDFRSDGRLLATASEDGTVKVWETDTWQPQLVISAHESQANLAFFPFPGVMDVAFSPDGQRLATGGADGQASIWDAVTGERLLNLTDHTGWVNRIAFSPDGSLLATASATGDATVKIWDTSAGRLLQTLAPENWRTDNRGFWAVDFSPDGSLLIVGRSDGFAEMWQLPDGDWQTGTQAASQVYEVQTGTGFILSTRFTPQGDRIAVSGLSGPVELRDAGNGDLQLGLEQSSGVWPVEFTPDGKNLITVGTDGSLQVFVLDLQELMALARSRVTRSLTDEECRQYLHLDACPVEGAE
jgi:WD40 repeat protein/DNA-binding SARP family transcriptional activator